MTRNITASFRQAAESNFSDDANLCFLTITHPTIDDAIRVVWDTVDYLKEGILFIGFPFDMTFLSDDESPPKAQLKLQNVDQEIGLAIRSAISPPRMKIEFASSADFNITVDPRVGTSVPIIYSVDRLFLTNVQLDVMAITADIVGWDYSQRTWPGVRARQDIFPGVFR